MARASGKTILAIALMGFAVLTAAPSDGALSSEDAFPTAAPSDGALSSEDAFPALSAGTLAGTETALPGAIKSDAAVLIFTFSKGAGSQAASWRKTLQERYGTNPRVEIWQILVLEDVPRLFRSVVTRGLRKGIPETMHGRALLLYQDAEVWKQRVGMRDDGTPCAVLVDAGGRVRWAGSGAADGALPPDLQAGVDALLEDAVR